MSRYGQVTWHIELTPEEVEVLDIMTTTTLAQSICIGEKLIPAQQSLYKKIKDMIAVSKKYPSRQEGDWVVRDKEPL